MANCRAVNGITMVCGDLLYPGGADKDFWVGYVSDLGTKISNAQTGDISSLSFKAYMGLVKFEGAKLAHVFSSEIQVGAGRNIAIVHRAAIKLITQSTADDVEIQRLASSTDAFIVYRNNNDQFFILGPTKGLTVAAGPLQSTGQNVGDDVSDNLILEGAEKTKPLRFFSSSVATTEALLDSYVR